MILIFFVDVCYSNDIPNLPNVEHASFAKDGMTMMEAQSLFLFSVRALIMFIIWARCQLPRSWNIEVDVDLIIQAITMDRCGHRENAGSCPEAPTMAQYLSSSTEERSSPPSSPTPAATSSRSGTVSRVEIHARWKAHLERSTRFIPYFYTTTSASGETECEACTFEEYMEELLGICEC